MQILTTATQVIERDGILGLTLDSVAAAAGLTKGGIQYHFTSKDDLIDEVEREILVRAEQAALEALGTPVSESSPDDRLEALIRSSAKGGVRKADLHLMLSGSVAGPADALRESFIQRWTGQDERPLSANQWVALLASDGLWVHDALGERSKDTVRPDVIDLLVKLAHS